MLRARFGDGVLAAGGGVERVRGEDGACPGRAKSPRSDSLIRFKGRGGGRSGDGVAGADGAGAVGPKADGARVFGGGALAAAFFAARCRVGASFGGA